MPEKKQQTTLTVSFPEDEMWIYAEISKHSCKGGFVKDVLADYLINICGVIPPNQQKTNKNVSISSQNDKNNNKPTEKSISSLLDF